MKVSGVALQCLSGDLEFRFSGSALGIRSVKTLSSLENLPLRTGCSEHRRAQQLVGRRALPFALRLLSIPHEALEADDAFCAWDEALKAGGLNPGSSADLTVATLMALFLCTPRR